MSNLIGVDIAVSDITRLNVLIHIVVAGCVLVDIGAGTGVDIVVVVGHCTRIHIVVGVDIGTGTGSSAGVDIVVVVCHCTRIHIVVGVDIGTGTGVDIVVVVGHGT